MSGATELQGDPRLALAGAFLLAIAAALAPAGIELARRAAPGRRVLFARWGFSHAALVALATAAALLAAGALAGGASHVARLWVNAGVLAVGCVAVWLSARATEPEPLEALGLGRGGVPRALLCGGVGYLFCLPAMLGAGWVWPWLWERFSSQAFPGQEVLTAISALSGAELLQAALIAVVLQPFLEELLFRGFLQPLLVQNLSDVLGVVVTSLVFALLHGAAFLPVFVLSLGIGAVKLRTQRLVAAWFVHALNNGVTLLLVQAGASPSLS